MGRFNKGLSLLFIVMLVASTMIMVESASAQSIPKPSVPEFTLRALSSMAPNNSLVQITIKNQAFIPYRDENGHYIDLYYNVSYKPHNDTEWNFYLENYYFIHQSSTNDTIIKHNANAGQMDFRVQAKIGYVTLKSASPVIIYEFTEQKSDWSDTQTIALVPTPPTSTPTVPEFSWLILLPLFILVLLIAASVRLRKTWKVTQY
jgi:hypothetical protein